MLFLAFIFVFYITLSRVFFYSTEKKQELPESHGGFHYCWSLINGKSLEIRLVPGRKIHMAYVAS